MEEIRAAGKMTFARYMDLALYHPGEGYYMREGEKIGVDGDFYTSPDVSPLFGMVLADQMKEMWDLSGRPDRWTLLEFGAGKGTLARDILNHSADRHDDFFQAMEYLIVERSPSMIRRQEQALSGARLPGRGIGWLGGPEELPPESATGCFFSNELLDSFPVHRLVKEKGRVREIYVAWVNGELREVTDRLSTPELGDYVRELRVDLEEGQAIEVCLAMRDWLKKAARALTRGFLLTIDYGDLAPRLHSPERPGGTIRSYRRHRLADSLYECPGGQDITAHVNFTDLIRWGEEAGLKTAGYTSQMYFLLNLGILDYLSSRGGVPSFDPLLVKETMAVKKLIMPEGMGSLFKVAVQYKGFGEEPRLTGFKGKYGCRS
ncbi:MAG: SAM-dependent methyltransferase [Peptococcaceae bacterium]|nr:SAM-dependent methyltransferase [Peptococcaceae bacterium]